MSERLTSQQSKAFSTVHRIAQQIRSMALSLSPGDYLGSEESLTRKLQITGPTLRQAIRLLEHEGVLRVKRGAGGGYFANRPDAKTVSRVAATYLRSNLQSIDEIGVVIDQLMPLLIDLALGSDRLHEFEPFADVAQAASTYRDSIAQQTAFTDLLWDVADNAPLKLLYAICYNVGSGLEIDPPDLMTPGVIQLQELRIEFAKALLRRDRTAAIELSLLITRLVHDGIKANVEKFASPLAPPGTRIPSKL